MNAESKALGPQGNGEATIRQSGLLDELLLFDTRDTLGNNETFLVRLETIELGLTCLSSL